MRRFPENLGLVLKMLSLSSAGLAAQLETDKSVISRWLKGTVSPSAHNLARLSALVATKVEGFCSLDWDREPESLAGLFGVDANALSGHGVKTPTPGLPVKGWKQIVGGAKARAGAYEGFYKCTRPHPMMPGRFVLEHSMLRRDPLGPMHMTMGSPETLVEGWAMPLQGLLYCMASDPVSGTMMFGIFNGLGVSKVEVFDGLVLIPAADFGRSPTSTAMLCERVGDLSGDAEADQDRFQKLCTLNPLAAVGAVPEHIQNHLARDFGPSHLAAGGDWLLSMSLARTLSRGPNYDEAPAQASVQEPATSG